MLILYQPHEMELVSVELMIVDLADARVLDGRGSGCVSGNCYRAPEVTLGSNAVVLRKSTPLTSWRRFTLDVRGRYVQHGVRPGRVVPRTGSFPLRPGQHGTSRPAGTGIGTVSIEHGTRGREIGPWHLPARCSRPRALPAFTRE